MYVINFLLQKGLTKNTFCMPTRLPELPVAIYRYIRS